MEFIRLVNTDKEKELVSNFDMHIKLIQRSYIKKTIRTNLDYESDITSGKNLVIKKSVHLPMD